METHKKVTDVVTDKTYYLKIEEETPEQMMKSQLPYIGHVLLEQMLEDKPEMFREKMKRYLEAMAEARQKVASVLGL